MKKTRIFKDIAEYERWIESFQDDCWTTIPAIVFEDNRIVADVETECKSWKTAVNRFIKAFEAFELVAEWAKEIKENCENGIFQYKFTEDSKNSFSWEVEETMDGYWYIFLNIQGIYAGKEAA